MTVAARSRAMTDLNSASFADITAAGFEPSVARELAFWQPYQSWEQLLLVGGMDEAALQRLVRNGFEITVPDARPWTPAKPFKLSSATR